MIFTDTDSAVREHPDLVREYFGTIIPPDDNKFAALNSAVWSGGSFIYVPKGVKIEFPLQAYFRINAENMGQFERTLIIVDEGAAGALRRRLHGPDVHAPKACTRPWSKSSSRSTPAAATRRSRTGPTTSTTSSPSGRWPTTTPTMEWIDGNLGSRLTMKYPAVYMMEPGARGEILSIAFASAGQHQDAGAKLVHCAPNTSSRIISKIDLQERRPRSYRGLVQGREGRQAIASRTSSATR